MIYEPKEDSELLRKHVKKHAFGRVLDVGTGSGIQIKSLLNKRKVKKIMGVDITKEAINYCKKNIKSKKAGFLVSDLFSEVKGKFNVIIFNPPYLPKDKGIDDNSLYGGRKGYEVLEKFLNSVNNYLAGEGIILVVFSSLTNKEKVDQIIGRNLLEFEELERKHFFFEDLFVYKIVKSRILRELERKGFSGVKFFAHGKRGNVFVGYYKNKKAAIKVKRKESLALERLKNEVKWLRILNKKNIGPRLLFYGENYLVYGFVEGDFVLDWIKKNESKKEKIRKIIAEVLRQCFIMDGLGVNKEEMHRPIKHIVINKKNKLTLIDFERCYKTERPHNVTQFGVFLMKNKLVNEKMLGLLKEYKREISKKVFNRILKLTKEN